MNLQMEISHRQVLIQNLTPSGLCGHLLTQLLLTQLSARLTDLMPAARLSGIGPDQVYELLPTENRDKSGPAGCPRPFG